MVAVTKEDVDTLKNDWLTDNVRISAPLPLRERPSWRYANVFIAVRPLRSGKSTASLLSSPDLYLDTET